MSFRHKLLPSCFISDLLQKISQGLTVYVGNERAQLVNIRKIEWSRILCFAEVQIDFFLDKTATPFNWREISNQLKTQECIEIFKLLHRPPGKRRFCFTFTSTMSMENNMRALQKFLVEIKAD